MLLFRGWFGLAQAAPVTDGAVGIGLGRSFDAWVSFAWIDLFLLAVITVTIAFVIMAFMGVRLRFDPGPVLMVLGIISFLLISYRLIFPPWAQAEREAAPFLALICCAAVAGGGRLSHLISSGQLRARSGSKRVSPSRGR
ncbi:MAG: hypothetical protein WD181_00575 [Solirubrobacterales bacterium]